MKLSVKEAETQLSELVRRAEGGEEVVLTRRGQDIVRLTPVQKPQRAREQRAAAIDRAIAAARARGPDGGPDAARSQDYLYDERGVPI